MQKKHRALWFLVLILALSGLPAQAQTTLPPGGTFLDDDGNSHEGAIEAIAAAGITTGCLPDLFCPSAPVTRAEMAAFLVRALGQSPLAASGTFSDVPAGQWYTGSGRFAPLVDPSTEEVLAEASSEGDDFGAALAYAREVGGPALRALSFAERALLLKDLSKLLHANREELLDLAQKNGGNTRGDAKFDVDGAIGTLAAYASFGEAIAKRVGDRRFLTDQACDLYLCGPPPMVEAVKTWLDQQGLGEETRLYSEKFLQSASSR